MVLTRRTGSDGCQSTDDSHGGFAMTNGKTGSRCNFPGVRAALIAFAACLALGAPADRVAAEDDFETIRIVATVPDLGSLARAIGGERVDVTVIAQPQEDAHFALARPSFVKALSEADAYIQVGLELELGYAPMLLNNARNPKVLPRNPGYVDSGNSGYIDASTAIVPLEIPRVSIDRSMGDVHAMGNPHYLLDPIRGLKVAALLRDRFAQIRPREGAFFRERYKEFERQLGAALVGDTLAAKYDAVKLASLFEVGKLESFLNSQGDAAGLGGWLGRMSPHRGAKVVDDHRMWPYFARRFGIELFGDLEPVPGIPPTTRHLNELVERMKASDVRVVITSAYYDPRHAQFIAEATGARVVPLAHQTGARDGTEEYLKMIDYNVRRLADALAAGRPSAQ
jgi:ABC-type Zn uptake system ZnuABC Zn-binding protein ZnuA